MKKIKLLLMSCVFLGAGTVWADDVYKDITNTYITNAGFEGDYTVYSNPKPDRAIYQPNGWTVSYTNGDTNDITALNSSCLQWSNFSGKAQLTDGGNKTYWVRLRWGTGAVLELSQTVTLPEGSYRLTAAYYKNGTGGDGYILVNSTEKNTSVNEDVWKSLTIDFTSDGVASTKIGCKAKHTAEYEKFLAFDNFVLEWNLTEALTSLIASATVAYNEDTSNTTLKAAIDAANDVKDSQDADELETAYNNLKSVAALAVNRKAWSDAKSAAEAAYGDGTYANVTGAEKVALATEIGKAEPSDAEGYETAKNALIAATSAFTAAKDSYDAYATAKAAATDVNEADVLAVVIAGNTAATAADALAASVILPKAQANKDATYAAPVVTDYVVNGTFDDSDISMWSCNNNFQNKGRKTTDDSNAGNMNSNKPWWENWNGSALVNKMYQTINNIPNGTYRLDITAFVNNFDAESQYVFANNDQTALTDAATTGATYEVYTVVTNNTIEVGLEQTTATANWMGIDNVSLRYYGAGDVISVAQNAGHKLAWEEAKAAAEAAVANDDYANVTGYEKTALQTEIAKAEPTTAQGYDDAAAALTAATSVFIAAKANYDMVAAAGILAYADPNKKPVITNETTAESLITPLRAYYESHAMAEGVTGAVDMTSRIANANAEDGNNSWTWTGSKNNPASNEPWTDADGNSTHTYFDGGNWNGSNWTTTMKQTISLPAGKFLLTAKGRAATNTTLTMKVGENSVTLPNVGNTGNVFDRGWGDASVEFITDGSDVEIEVDATASPSHEWFSISQFRLVRLELYTVMATSTEYEAMAAALVTAKAKTLGFEAGEYAPYTNVEAIQAIAAAEAVDTNEENAKAEIEAITTALGAWTANTSDMDAIYNGTFAEANGTNPKGWTRSNNGWGLQITGLTAEANGVNEGTTTAWYYNTNGAWQYGNDGVYTMPLAANQAYELTFKYRKNSNDWQSWMQASVLNSDNQGLQVVQYPGADNGTMFQSAKAYFTTGAAGNYILSIEQNGNAHLTDVSLVKAASATMTLSEGSEYVATDRVYYEEVVMTRSIKGDDTWNTFVVPFDISNEELKTAFGEDVAVAEFSENSSDANAVEVAFNAMTTPAITANTPVLLKGNAGSSFTFNGKLIKTGEAKVSGNNVDFVGTYAPITIMAGNYYISSNKLWKSNGEATIKGTRAYLQVKEETSGDVKLFIDDIETSISEINVVSENGVIYNLAGQRISKVQKGINIVNGKKILK
jgi:hypothetical protein